MFCCVIVAQAGSNFTPASNTSRYTEKSERAIQWSCFMFPAGLGDNKAAGSYTTAAGGWKPRTSSTPVLGAIKKILQESWCDCLSNNLLDLDGSKKFMSPKLQRWASDMKSVLGRDWRSLTCFINKIFIVITYSWKQCLAAVIESTHSYFISFFLDGWSTLKVDQPCLCCYSKSHSKLGFFQ